MTDYEYRFDGRGEHEGERLIRQSGILDPVTHRVWLAAGVATDMRVLDLGSGRGDVAMLTADIVGPAGAVVGIEKDADVVEASRERVADAGYRNIEIRQGDVEHLEFDERFDAVVGRLILGNIPDAVAALAQLRGLLKPGGIVCMQEIAIPGRLTAPATPLSTVATRVLNEAFRLTGPTDMGAQLFGAFQAAGLPAPELRCELVCGGPDRADLIDWFRDAMQALLPVIEREGLASAAELGLDTFSDRFAAELRAVQGITMLPPLIGAWCRLPTGA